MAEEYTVSGTYAPCRACEVAVILRNGVPTIPVTVWRDLADNVFMTPHAEDCTRRGEGPTATSCAQSLNPFDRAHEFRVAREGPRRVGDRLLVPLRCHPCGLAGYVDQDHAGPYLDVWEA